MSAPRVASGDAQLDAISILEAAIDRLARLPVPPTWIVVTFGVTPGVAQGDLTAMFDAFAASPHGALYSDRYSVMAVLPVNGTQLLVLGASK